MRPGYLSGFTLGSILNKGRFGSCFGEIPAVAIDDCATKEKDPKRVAENQRREKALRERFLACRKKLEATNWQSGHYGISAGDAKKALDLLEKAEERYWNEYKRHEGDKQSGRYYCIYADPDNVYGKALDDLWKAERMAGIIPPIANDRCVEKNDPRLSTHQNGEADLRRRFIAIRNKLHSVDWNAAGMVAVEFAKEANKTLKKAEERFWAEFRHYGGNNPFSKQYCIYAPPDDVYKKVLPYLTEAEEEVNMAISKAAQTTEVRAEVKAEVQAKQVAAQQKMEQLQQTREQFDLGPVIERPGRSGFFAWIANALGI